jgi:hypothetical protein
MEPDRTTKAERLLTWLGMWGAMRGVSPLAAAIVASVALLELLTPSAARLFPDVPHVTIHFFAFGIGLLLGLIGHFAADQWDQVVFDACYGPRGRWLEASRPPLHLFPAGVSVKRARGLAMQALPRRHLTDAEVDREAVKLARRQVERWEWIEHPLALARCVRGLLWPCVFAGILAWGGALTSPLLGIPREALRLLALGGACLVLALLLLAPYSRLRVEYLLRLYKDVAAHDRKKRPERH